MLREKITGETLSETIMRITKKSRKISDCFGAWKMTDKEEEVIRKELSEDGTYRPFSLSSFTLPKCASVVTM